MNDTNTAYSELVEHFSSGVARICGIYGMSPLLGRLYGTLFLTPEPMTLQDLTRTVGAAKSTVSVALRKLEALRMVRRHWKKGDRRDYYEAEVDMVAVLAEWLRMFVLPELSVGRELNALLEQGLAAPRGSDWPEAAGLAELRRRAAMMRTFTQAADALLARLVDARGNPDPRAFAALLDAATPAAGAAAGGASTTSQTGSPRAREKGETR